MRRRINDYYDIDEEVGFLIFLICFLAIHFVKANCCVVLDPFNIRMDGHLFVLFVFSPFHFVQSLLLVLLARVARQTLDSRS